MSVELRVPNSELNSPHRIEPAVSAADVEIIRTLFQEYAAELGVCLCFQGFEEELRTLPGAYAPPRGRLFLARRDGEPSGCVALRPLTNDVCEMKRLYVRPAFRRDGLGRALAERLMHEACELNYSRMVLDTLEHMTPARRLYQSLGFRSCKPYYQNPLPGVVYLEQGLRV